eukprot:30886-Pelagococcus_subviridis.AAC.17
MELKGVRSGVERRRARDPGRRDAPGSKVLKDRRAPRRRGRNTVYGTSVRQNAPDSLRSDRPPSSLGSNRDGRRRRRRPRPWTRAPPRPRARPPPRAWTTRTPGCPARSPPVRTAVSRAVIGRGKTRVSHVFM